VSRIGPLPSLSFSILLGCSILFPVATRAQFDFEQPPIGYRAPATQNAVARLEQKIRAGEVTLKPDADGSYLAAILDSLDIPVSSQSLVFTKTSLQQAQISPHSPRAIYFNDECYVGWVQNGFIEIGVMDDRLGAVFYTVHDRSSRPEFYRDRGACLGCHATRKTERVPGFFIRSVYPDAEGFARDFGTVSDHRSPFNSRWGGWYVTGSHGNMRHLGNELALNPENDQELDTERGANILSLTSRLETDRYLAPHSDLVALLVMEHQGQMHNLITLANYETLLAVDAMRVTDKTQSVTDKAPDATTAPVDSKATADGIDQTARKRIESAGDRLVEYLLFCDEAELTSPVSGTSTFADDFAARGPSDSKGRSLRQFDLETRLFRYRCSYLIYSSAFDALPAPVGHYVRKRILGVLRGEDDSDKFKHLSADERQAILEILSETKPDWVAGEAS
jgi:hypothetical protein